MMGRKRVGAFQRSVAVLVFLLLCHLPSVTRAGDEASGTYGASFLNIPIGARLTSVPDVVAGMEPDASLVFSNPAVVANLSRGQLFFSRVSWLEDLSLNAASVVLPVTPYDLNWSLGTRLLYSGDLKGYDDSNQVVAEESYYGLAFTTGVSKRFTPLGLSLGLGVSYFREHLPLETGDGFAMSLGASYQYRGHRVDFFANDLGGKIAFEGRDYPLDSRYVLGYGHVFKSGGGRLDVGGQMTISRSQLKRFQLGGAYHFARFFTLRGGMDQPLGSAPHTQTPVTAGLGFRYGNLAVDYAYASQEYFSNTHTFSVGFLFGQSAPAGGPADEGTMMGSSQGAAKAVPGVSGKVTTAPSVAAAEISKDASSAALGAPSYEILAGIHARSESARAEMRALQLLKLSAVVENSGDRFRVIVGKYESLEKANAALARLGAKGHHFTIDVVQR